MAPIAHIEQTTDSSRNLTIFKGTGAVRAEQVVAALLEFYRSGSTLNALWDLTEADLTGVDAGEIDRVITTAKEHAHLREGGKTAILVSRTVDFGIARRYEITSETRQHPISHYVFRDRDEALKWLGA